MNREDHLHNLDALASNLDVPAAPATAVRPRFFWLQITAAVVAGSLVSVGSLLALQSWGLLSDFSLQPVRSRPQSSAAVASAVPAAPVTTPAPVPVSTSAPEQVSADGAVSGTPLAPLAPAAATPIAGQPQPAVANAAPAALAPQATTAALTSNTTPFAAASAPSTVSASAAMPAPNATPNASADRQLFADRQSVDNLAAAVQALTLKVAELEKINSNRAKAASAKAQQLKAAAVETVPLARSRSEEIELSIFAISPTGVLVSDKGKPRLVPPGDKLPGGMTFLNFDPVTRRMKTDQGEYVIPALTP